MKTVDWKKVHVILIENSICTLIKDMKSLDHILSKEQIDFLIDEEVIKMSHGFPIIADNDYLDYEEFIDIINIIFKK